MVRRRGVGGGLGLGDCGRNRQRYGDTNNDKDKEVRKPRIKTIAVYESARQADT